MSSERKHVPQPYFNFLGHEFGKINAILRKRQIGVKWKAAPRAVSSGFFEGVRYLSTVLHYFFSIQDGRQDRRFHLEKYSFVYYVFKSSRLLSNINVTRNLWCKLILYDCANFTQKGLIWNAVNSLLCK